MKSYEIQYKNYYKNLIKNKKIGNKKIDSEDVYMDKGYDKQSYNYFFQYLNIRFSFRRFIFEIIGAIILCFVIGILAIYNINLKRYTYNYDKDIYSYSEKIIYNSIDKEGPIYNIFQKINSIKNKL